MKLRFLLDGMLGSLARWLRIYGYDTQYFKNKEDNELMEIAENEDRILLTRDEQLAKIANKKRVKAHFTKKNNDEEVLVEIVSIFNLILDLENSRCPRCNHELIKIDKNKIKESVNKNTYERFEDYWVCEGCNNIYWRGSHWKKILETFNKIKALKD